MVFGLYEPAFAADLQDQWKVNLGSSEIVGAHWGVQDAPAGMYDLIAALHGPTSLRELGLAESDIAKAAELATAQPYPNPRRSRLWCLACSRSRPSGAESSPLAPFG